MKSTLTIDEVIELDRFYAGIKPLPCDPPGYSDLSIPLDQIGRADPRPLRYRHGGLHPEDGEVAPRVTLDDGELADLADVDPFAHSLVPARDPGPPGPLSEVVSRWSSADPNDDSGRAQLIRGAQALGMRYHDYMHIPTWLLAEASRAGSRGLDSLLLGGRESPVSQVIEVGIQGKKRDEAERDAHYDATRSPEQGLDWVRYSPDILGLGYAVIRKAAPLAYSRLMEALGDRSGGPKP